MRGMTPSCQGIPSCKGLSVTPSQQKCTVQIAAVLRSRIRRVNEFMTFRAGPLAAALAALAVCPLAACSSAASPSHTAPVSSASAPASAVPASPAAATSEDCAAQVADWESQGGASSLSALGTDIGTLGTDLQSLAADMSLSGGAPAADESAVQSDAATVQGDAQAVEASPGPSCVPGMSADTSAAARYYSVAAIDADNSVNQMSAGNIEAATGDTQSATAAIDKGNARIQAATEDVRNFSGN